MMTPFRGLASVAVPLLRDNIDTDTIIPSREMKTTGRTGLADGLFAPWRYLDAASRMPDPDFCLNKPQAEGAAVLLGGKNFGCGSSREHAVWALCEYGIRAVVAESFAPIFQANSLRNGLLPIALPKQAIATMQWQEVCVDLAVQTISCGTAAYPFAIDAEARTMMLEGIDVIELTLRDLPAIDSWTNADRTFRTWVYLEDRK
jgi:3-isopropylmalate/(R)-2-methylmalate dehydratase small subunit